MRSEVKGAGENEPYISIHNWCDSRNQSDNHIGNAVCREEREMSTSLWAYDPERCDDTVCCGDCDLCMLGDITEEDIEEASPSGEESNPA